jgi:hypothetical protein
METVYDALMLPALNYAERDRLEGRLSDEEERIVAEETRELLNDVAELQRALGSAARPGPDASEVEVPADTRPPAPVQVVAAAANGEPDAIALQMLAQLVDGDAIQLDVPSARLLSSEIVDLVQQRSGRLVCIADLPPSPPSKTRYLVRKLRAALPDVTILVGRWAAPELVGDDRTILTEAGANHVATTLLETRDQLRILAAHERQRLMSAAPLETTAV